MPLPRATRDRLMFRLPLVLTRNGAVMRVVSAPVAAKHLSGTPSTRHWPGDNAASSGRRSGRPQSAPSQRTDMKTGAEGAARSEEHTSELQSLMRISYAVFCLKKKKKNQRTNKH